MRGYDFYVYIPASGVGGTLYTGVTNDLARRVSEHRDKVAASFTSRHRVTRLVYFEHHTDIEAAIAREKRIKRWKRAWKTRLVEEHNQDWRDLFHGLP
jgi:putative endonuclease